VRPVEYGHRAGVPMSLMIAIPSYDGKIHYDTMRGIVQTTIDLCEVEDRNCCGYSASRCFYR
jgi:hypothetical protein